MNSPVGRFWVGLFAGAIGLGAGLLFWVEPLLAKALLPYQGGSPSVWNLCMVFYQAVLLGGYGYAHWLSSQRSRTRAVRIHATVLVLALLYLPLTPVRPGMAGMVGTVAPAVWVLVALATAALLPFFVLASTSPLLQKWFVDLSGGKTANPYALYAASNGGSLLALVAFPFVIEPGLGLGMQSRAWSIGFVLLVGVHLVCAWRWRGSGGGGIVEAANPVSQPAVGWRDRGRWFVLSFVPSSLLLGVTSYLGADLASIPLLWVIPLVVYLGTFILVFAWPGWRGWEAVQREVPLAAAAVLFLVLGRLTEPVWLILGIHLTAFFVMAAACHSRLVGFRPGTDQMTAYYLWIAAGGCAGGVFNSLLAPVLFDSLLEYPWMVVAAVGLGSLRRPLAHAWEGDYRGLLLVGGVALWVVAFTWGGLFPGLAADAVGRWLVLGVPVCAARLVVERPWRCAAALGVAVAAVGGTGIGVTQMQVLFKDRNFFGVLRVERDRASGLTRLFHGSTLHGRQESAGPRRCEPLAYYHRNGPVGEVMQRVETAGKAGSVGVIGLGAGALAAYAQPGSRWTFFEIDPQVVEVAMNPSFFGYLKGCAAGEVRTVVGDARVSLGSVGAGQYDLLVLDAFSSDAIPVHLLTREALAVYERVLKPDGVLLVHISNRYLDLEPVIAVLARDRGWVGWVGDDSAVAPAELALGHDPSVWAVLARVDGHLGTLPRSLYWKRAQGGAGERVWTDDFSNVARHIRWR